MDLYKFDTAPGDETILNHGTAINGCTSKNWVERYSELGEIELIAPMSAGVHLLLPEGSFVGNVDSYEVMQIENHEIDEKKDEDPTVTITGRSFPVILEQRLVGLNQARQSMSGTYQIVPYIMPPAKIWDQIVYMINDHVSSTSVTITAGDIIENVLAYTDIGAMVGLEEYVDVKRGDLLSKVLELLHVQDLGIRSIRQNPHGVGFDTTNTIYIHGGVDRSGDVVFSWTLGDIESAKYLFSNKNFKNSAIVEGRFINEVIHTGTGFDRRYMIVDAADVDERFSAAPTGVDLTAVRSTLRRRGFEALLLQHDLTITSADISNFSKYQYRRDYNVGDLVTLDGNYGQMAVMRVTEYAEIEDEKGVSGHPTFALPMHILEPE